MLPLSCIIGKISILPTLFNVNILMKHYTRPCLTARSLWSLDIANRSRITGTKQKFFALGRWTPRTNLTCFTKLNVAADGQRLFSAQRRAEKKYLVQELSRLCQVTIGNGRLIKIIK